MKLLTPISFVAIFCALCTAAGAAAPSLESAPPVVVKTVPAAAATEVDPGLTEIRVTYSKAMQDGSWSWSTWGEDTFPELTGKPHYLADGKTCVLPVKLQPGKFYATWLNSDKFKNFTDAQGIPAVPYLLTFKTAQGQPGAGAEAPAPAGNLEDIKDAVTLHYDTGVETGFESINGSGHAVRFSRTGEAAQTRYIETVQIFASRYGSFEPPNENFHVYILYEEDRVLADVPFPYSMIERSNRKWYTLRTPSIEVPEKFTVALSFNPHRTKGIYMAYSETNGPCHSLIGIPSEGFEPWKPVEWMIRVILSKEPSRAKGFQALADFKPTVKKDPFAGCKWADFGGKESQGKQSYGGSGPAIRFKPADIFPDRAAGGKLTIKGIRLHASRYGSGYSPEQTFLTVRMQSGEGNNIGTATFPYGNFTYRAGWVDLVFEQPIVIENPAETLTVAFDPQATQSKGIYFHYQKNPDVSHSLSGSVANGFKPLADREWMVRLAFE